MIVAILGVGHGGVAMAADLTLAGHEVRLAAVPEHAHGLLLVEAMHGIYPEGTTSGGQPVGFARIPLVTTDVVKAIRGAEVVMVVVPAFGQRVYMDLLVEHGEAGQCIVFNPGKFASLEFRRLLGGRGGLLYGDTETLIYAAKMQGPDHVRIKAVKKALPLAALPCARTPELLERTRALFPQMRAAAHVIECAVNDPGTVLHPISTLMNTSRIEQMGPYRTGHYDVTPAVGRVIDAVDAERVKLAAALGFPTESLVEAGREAYGTTGATAYEALQQIAAHNVQMTPAGLDHRYITEEIPYAMVPMVELARQVGVETPGLEAIVHLGCMATGRDFRAEGRHLEALGLEGLGREGILARL